MHRRAFLCTSALILVGSEFADKVIAAMPSKPRPIKKGYMLSAFPAGGRDLPVLEKFKMIKAAGFAGVEPHGLMDQEEVLRARDAAGLQIPSVVIGSQTRKLNSPIPTVRTTAIDALKQALRDAKRYGARAVLAIAVGVHLDVGNLMYAGWAEHWIPVLRKRIATVHIKEYSRKKHEAEGKRRGFEVDYLAGDNNWPAIMRA